MTAKVRHGIPITEAEAREWQQAFIDIEESIENLDLEENQKNPYSKYLRLRQQDLF